MRILAALSLILALTSNGASAESPEATVLYVANEGFLIEVDGRKILIDAIFDDHTINYCHVPGEATLTRMQNGETPFDDIDVILFTHRHRDHFSAAPVLQRLTNDPSGVLVGPPQMMDELRNAKPELEGLGERVREVEVDLFGSSELEVAGIHIRAIRLRHSRYMVKDEATGTEYNRHEGVENLIYLIDVGGFKMIHVGDAVLSQNLELFEEGRFPEVDVDIAFLEFFDWSDETKTILDRWMTPDRVVFMHLPPQKDQIDKIKRRLSSTFANAIVFDEPGQAREF